MEGQKCIDVDNFMIELDAIDEQSQRGTDQAQLPKKNIKQQKLKTKSRRQPGPQQKLIQQPKLKSKKTSLHLVNTYQVKDNGKKKVIIIEEDISDQQVNNNAKINDQKNINTNEIKENIECLEEANNNIESLAANLLKMSMIEGNNEKQKEKRPSIKKPFPVVITDASVQTDEIYNLKDLEVFHLLKLTQNFILSLNSVHDKALKIYQNS